MKPKKSSSYNSKIDINFFKFISAKDLISDEFIKNLNDPLSFVEKMRNKKDLYKPISLFRPYDSKDSYIYKVQKKGYRRKILEKMYIKNLLDYPAISIDDSQLYQKVIAVIDKILLVCKQVNLTNNWVLTKHQNIKELILKAEDSNKYVIDLALWYSKNTFKPKLYSVLTRISN